MIHRIFRPGVSRCSYEAMILGRTVAYARAAGDPSSVEGIAMTKALDILSDSTYPQPDPVATEFGNEVLSAKRMFDNIADEATQQAAREPSRT